MKSNFGADEISEALSRLIHDDEIVQAGDIIASASYWHNVINRAATLIDRAHEKNPERCGLDLSQLRVDLEAESDKLFNAVISELTRNGFVRLENQIGRISHRPSLPLELLSAAENIRAALWARPFDPPDRKAFSQDRKLQQARRFLIDTGEIARSARRSLFFGRLSNRCRTSLPSSCPKTIPRLPVNFERKLAPHAA
jgi:hypothetical protein